jgi:hypothetical protein
MIQKIPEQTAGVRSFFPTTFVILFLTVKNVFTVTTFHSFTVGKVAFSSGNFLLMSSRSECNVSFRHWYLFHRSAAANRPCFGAPDIDPVSLQHLRFHCSCSCRELIPRHRSGCTFRLPAAAACQSASLPVVRAGDAGTWDTGTAALGPKREEKSTP